MNVHYKREPDFGRYVLAERRQYGIIILPDG